MSSRSRSRGKKLDSVAEGIADVAAVVSGQRLIGCDLNARLAQPSLKLKKVGDKEGGVSFAGGTEPGFDTKVHTDWTVLELATASSLEMVWLRDAGQSQNPLIERCGSFFFAWRHGQLNVMDGVN